MGPRAWTKKARQASTYLYQHIDKGHWPGDCRDSFFIFLFQLGADSDDEDELPGEAAIPAISEDEDDSDEDGDEPEGAIGAGGDGAVGSYEDMTSTGPSTSEVHNMEVEVEVEDGEYVCSYCGISYEEDPDPDVWVGCDGGKKSCECWYHIECLPQKHKATAKASLQNGTSWPCPSCQPSKEKCTKCSTDGVEIKCSTCCKSYHLKCLGEADMSSATQTLNSAKAIKFVKLDIVWICIACSANIARDWQILPSQVSG